MVRQEVNWEQVPLPEPPSKPPIVSKTGLNPVLEEAPSPDETSSRPLRVFPWKDPRVPSPWYVEKGL